MYRLPCAKDFCDYKGHLRNVESDSINHFSLQINLYIRQSQSISPPFHSVVQAPVWFLEDPLHKLVLAQGELVEDSALASKRSFHIVSRVLKASLPMCILPPNWRMVPLAVAISVLRSDTVYRTCTASFRNPGLHRKW